MTLPVHLPAHRESVVTLYRHLLRGVGALGHVVVPHRNGAIDADPEYIKTEYTKSELDPKRYLRYLQYELHHNISDTFRRPVKTLTKLRERMVNGVAFLETLNDVNQSTAVSYETWNRLLHLVVDGRRERLQGQKWRLEYITNRDEIELIRTPVNRLSQRKLKHEGRPKMDECSEIQKRKIVKQETTKSIVEASWLTGKYMKQLQQQGLIPLPSKLDYTKETYLGSMLPLELRPKTTENTPKSIAYKTIREAYDLDYVDAIIKPGLEYDINYHFYLKHLRLIVNEKGPYEVRIKELSSAPILFPYIKLPFSSKSESKRIAVDVARVVRTLRVLKVWKSMPDDDKVPEIKYPDGSYGVKGCKGFYQSERMFPAVHYQEWAEWEGLWEYLVSPNPKLVRHCVEEWSEYIKSATSTLDEQWQELRKKHANMHELTKEQTRQQNQMLLHYDNMINKYNSIVDDMEQMQVFKHSELVNGRNLVKKPLTSYLERDDKVTQAKKKGVPENGRLYMGKTLADVLSDNEYHSFKMGQKFKRELNFKDIDKFIRLT